MRRLWKCAAAWLLTGAFVMGAAGCGSGGWNGKTRRGISCRGGNHDCYRHHSG